MSKRRGEVPGGNQEVPDATVPVAVVDSEPALFQGQVVHISGEVRSAPEAAAEQEPVAVTTPQASRAKQWSVRPVNSSEDFTVVAAETLEDAIRAYNASARRSGSALARSQLEITEPR